MGGDRRAGPRFSRRVELWADADLLVWWHAPTAEALQRAGRCLRRTAVGRTLTPHWSAMGLHREAELKKLHIPAFLAGAASKSWATVYPFVRSHQWYLLPQDDRAAMLTEYGKMGTTTSRVLTNTVSAFAVGDYEWLLLALEADNLHDTVDLTRLSGPPKPDSTSTEKHPSTPGGVDPAEVAELLR